MNRSLEEKPSFNSLLEDLWHPNPNINIEAFQRMQQFWPEKSMNYLIDNLDNKDIELRRKCIKALAYFRTDSIRPVVNLYLNSESTIMRVSCLKVLVKIAANDNLDGFYGEIMRLSSFALKDESVEIALSFISLLRQLGEIAKPVLIELSEKSINTLHVKAASTALYEIRESDLY